MDYQTTLDSDLGRDLTLTATTKDYLMEAARWTRFIAIVGFVFVGLIVVGALFIFVGASSFKVPGSSIGLGTFAFIYLFIAVIYFFPVLYLFRFANKTRYALENMDSVELENGMENLKAHYKFIGILLIITLAFYALLLVVGIFTGVAGAFF